MTDTARRNARVGHPAARSATRLAGATLLELLLALALAALLLALLARGTHGNAGAAARSLETLVRRGRIEALYRGEAVALRWDEAGRRFELRRGADLRDACGGGRGDGGGGAELRLERFGRVRLDAAPADDLVWLPSGLGRGCRSGGAYNRTILLRGPNAAVAVIVSRAGRVRVEPR